MIHVNENADLRAVLARLSITHAIQSAMDAHRKFYRSYHLWYDLYRSYGRDPQLEHNDALAWAWKQVGMEPLI